MRSQDCDESRCFASRDELCSELGEVEKRLDGVFQQADSPERSIVVGPTRGLSLRRSGEAIQMLFAAQEDLAGDDGG